MVESITCVRAAVCVCLCLCVCTCARHCVFCTGTRHLSEQHIAVFHTNTHTHTNAVPFTHILTLTSQPSPPLSSPLLPGFPSSRLPPPLSPPLCLPLPGSFWFPFWFLTSGAISGWPAVPLILPAHCVASWAGPWAPGAGRGARNGLVPVAVLVKGTVAPFPFVHHELL